MFKGCHRITCITLLIMAFGFTNVSFSQPPIMITSESKLLDEHGERMTYAEFMKRMETGTFMPRPVKDDRGEIVAYQLAPIPAGGPGEERRRAERMQIQSTEIEGPVVINTVSHHYLFAPIDVFNGEEWFHYYVVLDTGTFVPVILLPEFMKEFGKVEKVRIGDIEFINPPTGAFGMPEGVRNMNRFRTEAPEKFEERTIAGIVGGSLFQNYLVSIDSRSGRITLRPLDSPQRTLHTDEPIASSSYRSDQSNIWIPATVNGVEGYAHYDTGNPRSMIVTEDVLAQANGKVRSLVIGDSDLVPIIGDIEPVAEEDMRRRYPHHMGEMNVLVNLGNRATDNLIVTIDPKEQKIYFERRKD